MKLKTDYIIIYLILLICSYAHGQIDQFRYRREISGITEKWHTIELPDLIFGKVNSDLSDIRIFGVTADHDTIEAPYLLQLTKEKILYHEVNFKLINQSHNDQGYYYIFELPFDHTINQIKLDFEQRNFDWRIILAGSQDLLDWFTILDDYRILSIQNDHTDYQFTSLNFPDSQYHYFRLLIKSNIKPNLLTAKMAAGEISAGSVRDYSVKAINVYEEKRFKQTVIDIDIGSPVPVCCLLMNIKDTLDYYRPLMINFLSDSFKTEQGWKYNYRFLASGILSSIEKNAFKFNSTILQKLRIIIQNYDNEPLVIDRVTISGYVHQLIIRFAQPADYFLVYGNKTAAGPNYDLSRFAEKIPNVLTELKLGDEQVIEKMNVHQAEPLFKNKIWLWAIIISIIMLLGWFSLTMIRKI